MALFDEFQNVTNVTDFENMTLTPDDGMTAPSWIHIKQVFDKIQYFTLPTILAVGLLGNCLSVLTMASPKFKHLTSRFVLIALALSDSVLLITQPFNKLFVIQLFGTDIRALSDLSCKVFFCVFRTAKMTSSWCIIMLCFERYVAVVFPLKAKLILRKRLIFAGIALNYLLIGTYNGVWTFSSEIVNGICKPDVQYPETKKKIQAFLIIGLSVYSFIPTCIMLILTPQIIYKVTKQGRIRSQMSIKSTRSSRREDEMTRVSLMVLGVMIAYIAFVLPIAALHYYAYHNGVSAFDLNTFGFFLYREIAQFLEQLNYAINFFFYVLCSQQFRRRVVALLTCCCPRRSRDGQSKALVFTVSTGSASGSGDVQAANSRPRR